MQSLQAKGQPIANANFGQGPSLLAQQLRSANDQQPRFSPGSTGRESQSFQFPLASISTTRFVEPGRGAPGSMHLSPFTQANERSRKMVEDQERLKREKAEGKAMERAGPEKKSQSPEKTQKVSDLTERSKMSGGHTDRTQQTSATTQVKKTARKPGELQTEAIRDLLQFDERELDQYAIKVKPENVRGATGGKWKQMRTLEAIFKLFFCPEFLEPEFAITKNGVYTTPKLQITFDEMEQFVKSMPIADTPEVFGLHSNADITYQTRESRFLLSTIVKIQPKISTVESQQSVNEDEEDDIIQTPGMPTSDEKETEEEKKAKEAQQKENEDKEKEKKKKKGPPTSDQIVTVMCKGFASRIPRSVDFSKAHASVISKPKKSSKDGTRDDKEEMTVNTLNIVLQQEALRFNRLLRVVHQSISDLQSAILGMTVMSTQLDDMFQSLLIAQVPQIWADVAYPSMRPLGAWVEDLITRVEFLRNWIEKGQPNSFLLPGFFFPQGFLTGVLQMHSRLTKIPIDTLVFRCHVEDEIEKRESDNLPDYTPDTGVYIHGLFLEGARWDLEDHCISESLSGQLSCSMPTMWLEPVVRGTPFLEEEQEEVEEVLSPINEEKESIDEDEQDQQQKEEKIQKRKKYAYNCPTYKTQGRYGVLSTTGHSTNYIMALDVLSYENPDLWIRRGAAFICEIV